MIARTAFAIALTAGLAGFSLPASALTPQQEKMKTCNTEATGDHLKGADRKTFMSSCLKSDAATAKTELTAQQEKMRTCNADASSKTLKGAARRSFMSECLKKS